MIQPMEYFSRGIVSISVVLDPNIFEILSLKTDAHTIVVFERKGSILSAEQIGPASCDINQQ